MEVDYFFLIYFAITITGIITNLYPLLFFTYLARTKTAFGKIASALVFCNLVIIAITAINVLAKRYLEIRLAKIFDNYSGAVVLWAYFTGHLIRIMISVNRYIAIFKPFNYDVLFKSKFNCISLGLMFVGGFLMAVPFALPGLCTFNYDGNVWIFYSSPFCDTASTMEDYYGGILTCSISLLIDGTVLIGYFIKKYNYRNAPIDNRPTHIQIETRLKNSFELRLFLSCLLSNINMAWLLFMWFYLLALFQNSIEIAFLFNVIIWMLYHGADGYVGS
uniref:7TM_GPCR_Srx domain-containing protein n=1 Tax=Rhabditophanes sp. KR3021 TaxID=114890 RepID=A0AC35TXS3_9BILA